jgi:voltage-gated potassium channel
MQSDERLRAVERITEAPLLVLAILFVPVILLPMMFDLPGRISDALQYSEWAIWGIFAAALLVKVSVAPRRFRYLRDNWFEVVVVVIPFLRPLRILRLVRVAAVLGVNTALLGRVAAGTPLKGIGLAVLAITVTGGALVFGFEYRAEGSTITSFGDAVWWAFVTSTTVGYGDHYPVTAAGRGVAVVLMLVGIAALSALTASVAAFLTREQGEKAELAIVLERLDALQAELAALREEARQRREYNAPER